MGTGSARAYVAFIDDHIVYAMLLVGLDAAGAGRILGLDNRIEALGFVQRNRWLRYLLG